MTYMGIDPGASGGIVVLEEYRLRCQYKMPYTPGEVWDALRWCTESGNPSIVAMELVTGYVGDKGNPGSAMFNFGRNVGWLEMALDIGGVKPIMVAPTRWQHTLGIKVRGKDESKTAWKNRLKLHAQKIFPDTKLTLATCDAALIAWYARMVTLGEKHVTDNTARATPMTFGRTM